MTKEKKPGDELFRMPYIMTNRFLIEMVTISFLSGLSFLWLVLK